MESDRFKPLGQGGWGGMCLHLASPADLSR